ncbi:Rdx family-domain-containing protein [Cryomyces antarcticus]
MSLENPAPNLSNEDRTDQIKLPRVAITYCTQCRWMLRAAYFAQELLSTFSTAIGEVALIPATGGIFTVHLTYHPLGSSTRNEDVETQRVLVWDRKAEGGFPETKILKQRIRNFIEPGRDLGHSDKPSTKSAEKSEGDQDVQKDTPGAEAAKERTGKKDAGIKRDPDRSLCEDCR